MNLRRESIGNASYLPLPNKCDQVALNSHSRAITRRRRSDLFLEGFSMTIRVAHLRIQGVNCAIFGADARIHSNRARSELLDQLVAAARASGLRVEKAALAYQQGSRRCFWGTRDLARYMAGIGGVPKWTHTLTL